MVRRNMTKQEALREAFAALQAGRFAAARDASAPFRGEPAGALLNALGAAGAGDADAAATLHAIARANPHARHPAHDLIDLLARQGRAADALMHLRAALRLAPSDPTLLSRLGAGLAETGPASEAIEAFRAVAAARGDATDWSNLGKALAADGRFEEAEPAFGRAAHGGPQLVLNHAVARLKSGRLAEGWPLFRARHALPGRAPPLPGPELTSLGGVAGRPVLLVHDEGFGDTLQFIRYAPLLARLAARVDVFVPPPLVRLLAAQGLRIGPGTLPRDALWCRIPDLPGVFGTTVGSIPGHLPYLAADPALAARWAARLPPGRRVGLVWAGAARAHDPAAAAMDRIRSIPVDLLGPLLGVPGVTWISLQHGEAPPGGVFDPMRDVTDFADTAAIIAALELVVSVDTAVVHLAAGMGKPVLLLDRYDNCWRWLSGREDSPWYPGVLRILRQETPGDWAGVLGRAAKAVARP